MSDAIGRLITALRCLPGVGPRTAQRMAYHLLLHARDGAATIAKSISDALSRSKLCQQCFDLCDGEVCLRCSDPMRQQSQLCVVEMPYDVVAIEQSGAYKGCYFVLQGRLSPLDGIGPEQLNIHKLEALCQQRRVEELIFALSTQAESEATVFYIMRRLRPLGLRFTQLAKGVPTGGMLEYLDASTIGGAIKQRSSLGLLSEEDCKLSEAES